MSEMKIKICGMRDTDNIAAIAALHPHYLGFIFYKSSPRYVGDEFVMPVLSEEIKKAGVWVNAEVDEISGLAAKHSLDAIQLHGSESPAMCAAIGAKGYQVIKAFSIDEAFDFDLTDDYAGFVDYFLFDTRGKYYGGNARKFNWDLLKKYKGVTNYFLSGGLSPEMISQAQALADERLHVLDFNSGIEISPGLKDIGKARQLFGSVGSKHIST